ncbi:MAG: zinc-ribbon domain [Pyrinomonadaceae bacterium]|nr:zinc-ribbon domain [Pyrinomonadaceae bacterium]
MVNCPRCGTAVREEKAFCHNCGSPMDAAKAVRETPLPDFGRTIIEPPRRPASPPQPPQPIPTPPPQPFVPPTVTEVQPAGRPTTPVSYQPAGVALPTPTSAPPAAERRKTSRKIGIGFVLLLLFLMLLAFVLAVVLD